MRLRPALRAIRAGRRPARLGSLGSVRPFASNWGYDRGTPVDRWYIEDFLARNRSDITGRVLEVKDPGYTERFGHDVSERAVLDVDPANERATIVADLAAADAIADESFDCFILTQTLQYVYDLAAAVAHCRRILAPGGTLLVTVPVTSRISEPPLTDYWRFTALAVERLLAAEFGAAAVDVRARGNVLAQVAFLEGLAAEDLDPAELARDDPSLPLLVTARAVRAR